MPEDGVLFQEQKLQIGESQKLVLVLWKNSQCDWSSTAGHVCVSVAHKFTAATLLALEGCDYLENRC